MLLEVNRCLNGWRRAVFGFLLAALLLAQVLLGASQWVAWSLMIAKYSQGASLPEAVEKTFGGEFPCELCKKVAAMQAEEEQEEEEAFVKKQVWDLRGGKVDLELPRFARSTWGVQDVRHEGLCSRPWVGPPELS